MDAYAFMNNNYIRTLPIVSKDDTLLGIITIKDIAMSLSKGINLLRRILRRILSAESIIATEGSGKWRNPIFRESTENSGIP
ncbi:MAG: CBS domain-containing protein [Eubacteriales bacterium]